VAGVAPPFEEPPVPGAPPVAICPPVAVPPPVPGLPPVCGLPPALPDCPAPARAAEFVEEPPPDVHETAAKKKRPHIHGAASDFMLLLWLVSPAEALSAPSSLPKRALTRRPHASGIGPPRPSSRCCKSGHSGVFVPASVTAPVQFGACGPGRTCVARCLRPRHPGPGRWPRPGPCPSRKRDRPRYAWWSRP